MEEYANTRKLGMGFEDALAKVKDELMSRGFGIVSEIDLAKKIKDKTGKEIGKYVLVGVCKPESAYEVLTSAPELGVLLPCGIAVYEMDGEVLVSAVRPTSLLGKGFGFAGIENIEAELLAAIHSI